MATKTGRSGFRTEDIYRINGIYPSAVEDFEEQLPEMEEGDFIVGGRFREDFKPFVYSGLISEFPVSNDTVFVVTERGENVSSTDYNERALVDQDPEFTLDQAPQILDGKSTLAEAKLVEEFTARHRRNMENEIYHSERPAWERYLDFGTKMLNQWEEIYQRASNINDSTANMYENMLQEELNDLTYNLSRLAETKSNSMIEPFRNQLYSMEDLTQNLE